jgi:hypothetical protein
MKTKLFSYAVICASALLVSATPSLADGRPSACVVRQARALQSLTSELVAEYREELHTHRANSCELALYDDFKRLDINTHELLYYLQTGGECCVLKRSLLNAQRTFQCADNRAGEMSVCSCVRTMMRRIDQMLDAIGDEGFESGGNDRYVEPRPHYDAERRYDDDRRYDDRSSGRGNDRASNVSAIIQGLLQAAGRR